MSPTPSKTPSPKGGLSADAALFLVELCVRLLLKSELPVRRTSSMRALAIRSTSRLAELSASLAQALLERGFRVSAGALRIDAGMSVASLASRVARLARPMKSAASSGIKDLVPAEGSSGREAHVTWVTESGRSKTRQSVLDKSFGGPVRRTRSPDGGGDGPPARHVIHPVKVVVKKAAAKKAAGKKAAAKKVTAKKVVAKKAGAKKPAVKKPAVAPISVPVSAAPEPSVASVPASVPFDLAQASQALAEQTARMSEQMRQMQQMQMQHAQIFDMMQRQSMAAHSNRNERWMEFMREKAAAPAPAPAPPPAPPPPPAPASAVVKVNATPQMDFDGPPEDEVYAMSIWLDQGPAAAGAEVQGVTLEVSADATECRVDVWMDCSAHFTVQGLDEDSHLTLAVTSGTSEKLPFKLNLVDAALAMPMYVTAFFRYEGRPCGKIARFPELADGVLRWKEPTKPVAPPVRSEVVLPLADSAPSIAIQSGRNADIRVEVIATKANDGQHYLMNCMAHGDSWKGEWNLGTPPRELVTALMDRFMKNKKKARIASLKAAGQEMWKTLDPGAAAFLFDAIKKGATTLSVLSEEPYIPWELMVPHTTPQDAGEPLGIRLQMGRWIAGNYIAPPQALPLQSAYVVSPVSSELVCAADEIKFLLETVKSAAQLTPATIEGIDAGLAATPRDLLHFVCHGKSGVLQTLKLNTPDELDCVTVLALEGFLSAFQHRPMVFLNACEVGSGTASLDGVGGFANSFMELGAAAVVAPLWAVQDKAALEVTRKFYPDALRGIPLAKIFQDIRRMAYTGDAPLDSYAAYCFYGDPLAVASAA